MLQSNQTVYFTMGPLVQKATFDHYDGQNCVLRTPLGQLTLRRARVFTQAEADEMGLIGREERIRASIAG